MQRWRILRLANIKHRRCWKEWGQVLNLESNLRVQDKGHAHGKNRKKQGRHICINNFSGPRVFNGLDRGIRNTILSRSAQGEAILRQELIELTQAQRRTN